MNILKQIGIVIAALAAAMVLIMLVQQLNLLLFPLPDWVDTNNPEHLSELMSTLPLPALLMVELSYVLGSLAAGLLLAFLTKGKCLWQVLVVGGLLTLAGFANLASVQHPLWLAVLTTVTYVPVTYLGSRLLRY